MCQEVESVKCQTSYVLQESFLKDRNLPGSSSGVMKTQSLDRTSVWECWLGAL